MLLRVAVTLCACVLGIASYAELTCGLDTPGSCGYRPHHWRACSRKRGAARGGELSWRSRLPCPPATVAWSPGLRTDRRVRLQRRRAISVPVRAVVGAMLAIRGLAGLVCNHPRKVLQLPCPSLINFSISQLLLCRTLEAMPPVVDW